jgi:quercetin dioxygenase-like cupin family protein
MLKGNLASRAPLPTHKLLTGTSQHSLVSGQWLVEAGHYTFRSVGNHVGETAMKNTAAALVLSLSLAGSTLVAQDDPVRSLSSKDLAAAPDKEISMITVEYPPGGSTPAHTHHAQALLYVLEGSIVMQVKGKAPVTLTPGQTWYEGPEDVHVVSRNASNSAPAKYLVCLVKDKGAPLLTPVK